MSNIMKSRKELISYIKNVVFKYCPYVDNRLLILDNVKSPELDIKININNNGTQIMFIFGNYNFKTSIPERASVSYIISFEEICDVINFLLEDHEIIKDIYFYNLNINLKFAINWTEKNIKGINCGDIDLNLNFENLELKKQYLYMLFQKYYTELDQVPSFRKIKKEYIDNIKHLYFDALNKPQLIALLDGMLENELKELLYNLDNDVFIKYTMDNVEHRKVRTLSLKDNKKN